MMKKQIYTFPGIYENPGKNKVAYINIADGKVHRIDKNILERECNQELLKNMEEAGIGLALPQDHILFDLPKEKIEIPEEEWLKVSIQGSIEFIKYVEFPIKSIHVFSQDINSLDKEKINDILSEYGHFNIHTFYRFSDNPFSCPFNLIKEKTQKSSYFYFFFSKYNPCWGLSLAIDQEGNVKPCLWSDIVVGNITSTPFTTIIEKMKEFWYLTKKKIDGCKDCELNVVCTDCRVLAKKEKGSIQSKTPCCDYNP